VTGWTPPSGRASTLGRALSAAETEEHDDGSVEPDHVLVFEAPDPLPEHRPRDRRDLVDHETARLWGALRLTTTGRRCGQERSVIVGYLEDGPNLVVLAMNGWENGHPAWWLNLEAHPDAVVRLAHQRPRLVRARPAAGEERDRLWQQWAAIGADLDAYASRRSTETPVVVFEPREGTA
jgi:F420H(2)-dependent quinone reductase